jgi:hypothetical protein
VAVRGDSIRSVVVCAYAGGAIAITTVANTAPAKDRTHFIGFPPEIVNASHQRNILLQFAITDNT